MCQVKVTVTVAAKSRLRYPEAGVENTKQNTTPDTPATFKERQPESLNKP